MTNIPEKKARTFLPEDFEVSTWDALEPYFEQLLQRDINSVEDLRQLLRDDSELSAVLSEDLAWRYIKMTCNTGDKALSERYKDYVQHIQPKMAPFGDRLNKKVTASPYLSELEKEEGYDILIREMKKNIEIFREENVPLFTEIGMEGQKYGQIIGAMTVDINGEEMTLPQANVRLQSDDRTEREEVYRKIADRRLQDREDIDGLYTQLIDLRYQVAKNADYPNFRDYKFRSMGRFDYTPQDCFDFHEAVAKEVVPMLDTIARSRKEKLGVDTLRPWDKSVDADGHQPLKPFENSEELLTKSIVCFSKIDPFLGQCLAIMKEMGHLDLASRKNKAPGGYNYPLSEIGVPFIFMNATSTLRDMVTLMHEGGHAVHSFLTRDLELVDFQRTPSEVAELASMSMELISMDHWDLFFEDAAELKRAKREHLEQIIETLPWVATIDKFQHWIYENPDHSQEERIQAWNEVYDTFSDNITDWTGLEEQKNYMWQKQLHLFEIPFYYIEYGMAQLGAVAIWKNYKEDKQSGLEAYMKALKLGYTRSIPEVYAAADIRFDFSASNINQLIGFVQEELERL